jgi:hypothetical protein
VDVGGTTDHSSCSWEDRVEAGGVLSSGSRSGAAALFVEIIGTTRVCCIVSVRTVLVVVPSPSRLSSAPGRRLKKNNLRRGDHDRRSFSGRANDVDVDVVSAAAVGDDETGNRRRNRETMVRQNGDSDSCVYVMGVQCALLLPKRSWSAAAGHDPFFLALRRGLVGRFRCSIGRCSLSLSPHLRGVSFYRMESKPIHQIKCRLEWIG